MSKPTFYSYIDSLKLLYIIEDIKWWSPKIRSKTAIRTTPKRVFVNPSIGVAALNKKPEAFLTQDGLETFSFIFKNLCIRDLSIYTSSLDGNISYYHDNSGLEVDCVVHLKDGRYALIECKLGRSNINKGCENLIKISKLIEKNDKVRKPEFLAILTNSKVACTRPDGVKILPIGCLKD